MWSYEHTVETTATSEAIWRLWSDVEGWPAWNRDIERIRIDGRFAAGSTISMTPRGQDEVQLRLAEVAEKELFVDEAQIEGLKITTIHRIDLLGGRGVRVVYRMEITGTGADQLGPQLGPQISADFPETAAELVRRAERGATAPGETRR